MTRYKIPKTPDEKIKKTKENSNKPPQLVVGAMMRDAIARDAARRDAARLLRPYSHGELVSIAECKLIPLTAASALRASETLSQMRCPSERMTSRTTSWRATSSSIVTRARSTSSPRKRMRRARAQPSAGSPGHRPWEADALAASVAVAHIARNRSGDRPIAPGMLKHEDRNAAWLPVFRSITVLLVAIAATWGTPSASAKPGATKQLVKKDWGIPATVTAFRGKLYVSGDVTVYAVDKTGKSQDVYRGDTSVGTVTHMTVLDDVLYALGGSNLYRVENNGKLTQIGDGYQRAKALAAAYDRLFIVSDEGLWRIAKNGDFRKLEGDWYVEALTELDGKLYALGTNGELWELDRDGNRTLLSKGFENATRMTSMAGMLYVYTYGDNTSALHEVDKTGKSTVILPGGFGKDLAGARGITALDGKLYAVTNDSSPKTVVLAVDTK